MKESPLSFSQMAEHVAEHGGGSFDWHTGGTAEGPGFMVSHEGAETVVPKATPEVLQEFHKQHAATAAMGGKPYLGAWQSDSGDSVTLDVSRKIDTPKEAREFGVANKQEAAFALPGTKVMPGVKAEDIANPWGALVNFHSQLKGVDADPGYNRTGDSFTKNEVENADWDKQQGELGGKPVSYRDLMTNLNKARTERLRGQ